ncbi:MAG: hypothetical protein ACK4RS_05190 [Thiothrix sp.]
MFRLPLFIETKRVAVATAVLSLLAINPVAAGQVTLASTNNGQLAFTRASWSIFKRSDKERQHPVAVLPRHTGVLNLPEGEYVARLTASEKVRETDFEVNSDGNKLISLPVD